jgi:hypothetical protein
MRLRWIGVVGAVAFAQWADPAEAQRDRLGMGEQLGAQVFRAQREAAVTVSTGHEARQATERPTHEQLTVEERVTTRKEEGRR